MSSKGIDFVVIGVGNPLRSDDGVGCFVARELQELNLPDVHIKITQQLHVEFLEEISFEQTIIVIDASISGEEISFCKIDDNSEKRLTSSHHLGLPVFISLAQKIYKKDLDIRLCSIRGNCFEMGDVLSTKTAVYAQQAIKLIKAFISKKTHART